jgi:hypothetical protein
MKTSKIKHGVENQNMFIFGEENADSEWEETSWVFKVLSGPIYMAVFTLCQSTEVYT